MANKVEYLESVDIFRDLPPQEMESVGNQTTMKHYEAGHLFFSTR